MNIRTLASAMAERLGLASIAGITFSGKRDLFAALGYKRDLRPQDYRDRWKRGGIASRVVEAAPKATWRQGAQIVEDEDPEVDTLFEEQMQDIVERLRLWAILTRADVLAGLGRYSVVLIGAPGKFDEELPRMTSPEQIAYLSTFGEEDVDIESLIQDETDPRYGMPEYYRFKRTVTAEPTRGGPKMLSAGKKVHWTRVVHVAENLLDNEVYGASRLERVWNLLDDLDKITGGGAEAFWRRVHQGFHFNLDKDLELDDNDIEGSKGLEEQMDEFAHGMRRTIATRGMAVQAFGSDTSNISPNADAILTQISGTTGIPKRILVGSEMGELASTQDRSNWADRIVDRRGDFAEPLVRQFVDRLIEYGALVEPEEYLIWWPDISSLDELQKASVAGAWASLGPNVVKPEEIREHVLGLDPLVLEEEPPVEEPPVEEPPVEEKEKRVARRMRVLRGGRYRLTRDGNNVLIEEV